MNSRSTRHEFDFSRLASQMFKSSISLRIIAALWGYRRCPGMET